MIIKKYLEPIFGVLSYVLIEKKHCIVIDPIMTNGFKREASKHIVDFAFITHEHFDHIRNVNDFKSVYSKPILCSEKARNGLSNPSINMSRYLEFLLMAIPFGNHKIMCGEYNCFPDGCIFDNQVIIWQGHSILFKETPGHSKGSICILVDNKYLFSGDTIFKEYATATKMPGGSTKAFKNITEVWLDTLSPNTKVFPGHTKPFKLSERYK